MILLQRLTKWKWIKFMLLFSEIFISYYKFRMKMGHTFKKHMNFNGTFKKSVNRDKIINIYDKDFGFVLVNSGSFTVLHFKDYQNQLQFL